MQFKAGAFPTVVGAFLSIWALSLSASAQTPHLTPYVVDVLAAPRTMYGADDRRHLVYELRIANPTSSEVKLSAIHVIDSDTGKMLLELGRDDIAKRFSIGGRRGAESADLGVGQFGVLFAHVALDPGIPTPKSIAHQVTAQLVDRGLSMTTTVGQISVEDPPPVVLGPPLIGKGYVAGDGCCDTIRHVRALLPLNGRFALAQRFAIDWEQVDGQNRLVNGNTKTLSNYTIFGKEVIAVANGTVVAIRNDLPEQVPGKLPKNLDVAEADGNFIVLDIGNGAYVLYAHLQPGSVKVTVGAKVRRGQALAKVGNTGNSQAPHLHLHVMDGPSPLLSNGIPYVIDEFRLTAVDRAGTADFDKAEATGAPMTLSPQSPPQQKKNVLPMDLMVVDFSRDAAADERSR
ncbi:Peptidase family M23 [Enhydrobacter aerosaccus]|uniref:Peptidase family M23 n=1 Tax=Enhydrobacter aerosaccus TaxID=225324 RepID=A0A1T4NU25_9HYPH|nr:M23 family metallopeptidase [Enhydrobacter aerosaccus]SJZ82536.1 Peptidase family M23 [Enhydrobacter aerosaccus]